MSSDDLRWDMGKILAHYGADVNLYDYWTPLRCPFHDDSTASASASLSGFRCHTCGIHGDGIKVIMEVEHCDFRGAIDRYERYTGNSGPTVRTAITRKSWGIRPYSSGTHRGNDQGFSARVRPRSSDGA